MPDFDLIADLNARLTAIEAELAQKVEPADLQTDALTDAQLRATPVKVDDDESQAKLEELRLLLDTVETKLQAINDGQLLAGHAVTVSNPTADPETGLAKDSTLAAVLGQLDDATADTVLSVLKALLTELAQKVEPTDLQTDALTDAQLRATPVKVDDDESQAKLEELRLLLDTVEAKLQAINDAQLLDNHQVTVSNQVLTKAGITKAVEDGQVYTAGGEMQTTQGTEEASATLENPSASGVTLVIASIAVQVDVSGELTALFLDGGTSTGDLKTPMNHLQVGGPAAGKLRMGVDALTGATELSPRVFLRDLVPFSFDGAPVIITPGAKKSIRITGQTLTTINYRVNVTWVEVPLV